MAHHLEAVGDLDHAHARVGAEADYQFLVLFSLKARILGLDGGNLVEPVDHHQHFLRECADIHILVGAGGFVQIHRRGASLRQADFARYDIGHPVGMRDKGGAVITGLSLQCSECYLAGLFYHAVV